MCVDIMDGEKLYRFYFIIFYYFGVIIGLNIVIAFAIDMYSAVVRLDEQKEKNEKYLVELANRRHSSFFHGNNSSNINDQSEQLERTMENASETVSLIS